MLRFNGTWKIDMEDARKWDTASRSYIPDAVGEEIITIRVEDGVQNYEVLYGDDPVIRMGYIARFDAAEWVPYSVREIVSAPGANQSAAVEAFRERIGANEASNARNFQVGRPYGIVRLVYIDERTHYRTSKTEDGRPQNVLLRRLAEDGRSYMTSLLDAKGIVSRIRPFIRVT